jgi:PAS domain S-box-containing protein
MTKRKVAEDAIKLSEEKFRAVAESIPAQVVIFQDEKFVYVNPYSYNITGYTAEEMLEMNFWDLVHSDFAETAKQRGISRQKGELVPDNYEMKIITKSGEVKWINYSARVIDYNGKPAVVGVATNISEIKKAEDALKHSLHEKEILLKEIHHRVKNNLQIVSSLLKIQSSYVDDENVKQLFKESQNRVQSMSLIHQKLYQTKDLAHIDFREYIDTVSTHLQHSFGILEDKVEIKVDVHNIAMSIDNAIPAGLIINELITNALKHAFGTSGKGEIYINLAYDEFSHEYWLVVRDNGSGIRNDFDINRSGSFGLKLVSTLVGQMGGAIDIISRGGTEFRIMFKNVEYKERN